MTLIATAPDPEFPKLRIAKPPRNWVIAGAAAAVAHAILLAVLAIARAEQTQADPDPTMEVSLIPAAAFAPQDLKRPPSAPAPPKPVAQQPQLDPARPTPQPEVAPEATRAAAVTPSPAPAPSPAEAAPTPAPPGPPAPAVTPPSFTAAYLNNPGPQYPYESRVKRQEGIVRLKVLVTPEGRADQVLVERSSGFPALDEAALDVVKRRWRFVPAKQDGRSVSAWVVVPMAFSLKTR